MRVQLPELSVPAPWTSDVLSWSADRGVLRLTRDDATEVTAELQRCVSGRLRNAYPVSTRDVEVQVLEPHSVSVVTAALSAVTTAILDADPQCRKVVYVVDDDALDSRLRMIGAAEAAGFRYVLDIDIADTQLSLLVAEPDWVTHVDIDLDRVPGT